MFCRSLFVPYLLVTVLSVLLRLRLLITLWYLQTFLWSLVSLDRGSNPLESNMLTITPLVWLRLFDIYMLALYFGSIISDILFMFLNEEQTSKSQQKTVMHITMIAAGILLIEGILQKCADNVKAITCLGENDYAAFFCINLIYLYTITCLWTS